jgi:hypothetical protein
MAASLSPPDAAKFAKSANLSQSSTFGNLIQPSNRRVYAYLIGTLNASHPDYDLSNVLRPQDFCRERDVQDAINEIDAKVLGQDKYYWQSGAIPSTSARARTSQWGYDKWLMIDEEMDLRDCEVYNFAPQENPFDGDGVPLWSLHYFFFNRAKKRVCYIQVRAIDPTYNHSDEEEDDDANFGVYNMDSDDNDEETATEGEDATKRPRTATDLGASKRARYWLGDRYGRRSASEDEKPQVDIESIHALVEYRRRHPEEFPEILDEEEEETTDGRGGSASPTPGSSGEESEGGLKVPGFGKRRGSDFRALSADLSRSADI